MSLATALVIVCTASSLYAQPKKCGSVQVSFQTASDANRFQPQIVGWLEDAAGQFVTTIYITHQTGTFGIGNRPGRFDFDSGPFWPYGRRVTTFPVWAHKHGLEWPELGFQDGDDSDLSHNGSESSIDEHFCRPLKPAEFDAQSCPSVRAYTDKGKPTGRTSLYPPREDIELLPQDHPSVEMFAMMNPFDAVSQPTPPAGVLAKITWPVPVDLAPGTYTLWLEVAKEFDMNDVYNATTYPSPTGLPWAEYGDAYRGQPSVLYRVPFVLGEIDASATTDAYVGYGDPDGLDGNIRVPDATISTAPGSGAARLALVSDGEAMFRVRVDASYEVDELAPAAPRDAEVTDLTANRATIGFIAPGDDGDSGKVTRYEVRYRVRESITEASFADATLLPATIDVATAGAQHSFELEGLLPETRYSVALRAHDNCGNASPLAIVDVETPERPIGEVDACFIATAAYGSVMAEDVEQLRRFRDSLLAKTPLGELAIETYYTFGPAFAGVVGESDVLRGTARELLAPIVGSVTRRSP